MTFDEHDDPFDPVVAERFELLDRVEPPPVPVGGAITTAAPGPVPGPEPGVDRRRRYALIGLAAATLATLAGLSAVALTGGGDQGIEAVDAGPAAGEDDGDGERSAGPIESPGQADPTTTTMNASTVTEDTPIVVDESSSDDGQDGSAPTVTAQATSLTTAPTTAPATVPSTVEETTTASTAAETGRVVTIAGLVTEVFTD